MNEPNEKAFPPPNTQHFNLFFFTEKKESLKNESNSSHSSWKGLIMSNVKIMTCQAQSNKVPSQCTNAELKM